jgi:16S rRNA (cytidine1402-2'-O)-methyltransferase
MYGNLYIVATPIGNLSDITIRAKETLEKVDLIVCEDTRVTSKLLSAYGISKPLRSIHEHSTDTALDRLIDELKHGKNLSYVSDAGTPGVNDPGGKFVSFALGQGISVIPIPGPSALTTAISVCGFPMDEFAYDGFVPQKKGRETFFKLVSERTSASVFFESTHRILKTISLLSQNLESNRMLFIGRELTKIHETLYRGTIDDVKRKLEDTSHKGEFVIIVAPKKFS